MNRRRLIEELIRRNWKHRLLFGGIGPYLEVQGIISGVPFLFFDRVPVRLADDHKKFWNELLLQMANTGEPCSKDMRIN